MIIPDVILNTQNLILAVNPGSTSTKVALFDGDVLVVEETLRHSNSDLAVFNHYSEQLSYRINIVHDFLDRNKVEIKHLVALVGRGGLMKPLSSGAYRVNEAMIADLRSGVYGEHASNLGAQIVYALAEAEGLPSFIVDPVSVDEFEEVARYSGLPDLPRLSLVHTLNTRAIAHRHAKATGQKFTELNVVVAHLGGGLSISPLKMGRIIDSNNANEGGPMSPERAGSLPSRQLAKLCLSGKYTPEEMLKLIAGKGGLTAHLGTNDLREAEKLADEGNTYAEKVLDAMFYQIGKEIGAVSTALKGKCTAILLTGGMAYSELLVSRVKEYVEWIAPVFVYPGEDELSALAEGVWRALSGIEEAKQY